MAIARAGNVNLEYFVAGPDTAKTTLVLIHGWTYGARMWVRFQAELAERGIRSVSVNARGMGGSDVTPRDEDYTCTQYAIDLKALLDGLGIERYHLIGQCQGGLTALRFLQHYAEPVQSLVLIGAPTRPKNPEDLAAFDDWVERYPATANHAAFEKQTRGLSPSERERLFQDWTSIAKPRLRGSRVIEDEELAPILHEVKIPVLYVCGDQDTTVPLASSLNAFQKLPPERRSLHIFHGAEHMLPCLVPRELADLVNRFLEKKPFHETNA